ncbi:putative bacteriophage protein [Acinetobacter baumannii]|nr:putative bacteriophage protein [Acinetobacter baumannii]
MGLDLYGCIKPRWRLIHYREMGLHEWVTDIWGMIALGGFFFVCGLPGWALVRWIFNFINKQEGKTIIEVLKEVKKAKRDIENS